MEIQTIPFHRAGKAVQALDETRRAKLRERLREWLAPQDSTITYAATAVAGKARRTVRITPKRVILRSFAREAGIQHQELGPGFRREQLGGDLKALLRDLANPLLAFALKLPLALLVFLVIAYQGAEPTGASPACCFTLPILNGVAIIASPQPIVVADAVLSVHDVELRAVRAGGWTSASAAAA